MGAVAELDAVDTVEVHTGTYRTADTQAVIACNRTLWSEKPKKPSVLIRDTSGLLQVTNLARPSQVK